MKRIALIALVLLVASPALARVGSLADAPAIRKQNLIHDGRHEITVTPAGVTLGGKYNVDMLVEVGYQYHLAEWVGLGVEVGYGYLGIKTGLTKDIEKYQQAEEPVARSGLGLLALAKASITPLSGKIVTGGKLLGYMDFHINLGVGLATIKYMDWQNPPASLALAVLVGGGVRFFPIKLISINLDVNDYMVLRKVTPKQGKTMTQNPAFLLGLSFFLPEAGRGE